MLAYTVHPKKQPLQVRLPGGLRDKESRMGRGRWGSVPSPASEAWRSTCRAEEALRLDECLSPGILGRPRSLGEGHLPTATQSLVVELGLPLAPFPAHSACLGLEEDSDTPVVPQTENLSPGEGRESHPESLSMLVAETWPESTCLDSWSGGFLLHAPPHSLCPGSPSPLSESP